MFKKMKCILLPLLLVACGSEYDGDVQSGLEQARGTDTDDTSLLIQHDDDMTVSTKEKIKCPGSSGSNIGGDQDCNVGIFDGGWGATENHARELCITQIRERIEKDMREKYECGSCSEEGKEDLGCFMEAPWKLTDLEVWWGWGQGFGGEPPCTSDCVLGFCWARCKDMSYTAGASCSCLDCFE